MGKKKPPATKSESVKKDVPTKRSSNGGIPSVTEMGPIQRKRKAVGVMPMGDGNIHLICLEYVTKGSIYDAHFDSSLLIKIVTRFDGVLSPLYLQKKTFELYGRLHQDQDDAPPQTCDDITDRYAAVFSYASKRTVDVDEVGWSKNVSCWYVSQGQLKEFLMFYDDVMFWRFGYSNDELEQIDPPPKIVVHIPPLCAWQLVLDQDADELQCQFEVRNSTPPRDLKADVFQAPPPTFPNRIVIMEFGLVSETKMHIVFGGDTLPFKDDFSDVGIPIRSFKRIPEQQYPEYFRLLEHLDISNLDVAVNKVRSILTGTLYSSPVFARIKDTKTNRSNLEALISGLADLPNLRREWF